MKNIILKILKEETNQEVDKKLKLLQNIVNDFFLSEKNDSICDITVTYNDHLNYGYLITVIFLDKENRIDGPFGQGSYSAKKENFLNNIWHTIYDLTSTPTSLLSKTKNNCD